MLEAIDLINEKYINEAEPGKEKPKKNRKLFTMLIAAALTVTVLIAGGVLFASLANRQYGEYTKIVKKIKAAKKNDKYYMYDVEASGIAGFFNSLFGRPKYDDVSNGVDGSYTGSSQRYEEITDNQTEGVIEGDLIKRSDRYIYYLRDNELAVYTIEGENSDIVSSYKLRAPYGIAYNSYRCLEMYLSEDCETVTVITSLYTYSGTNVIIVIQLDVTDPTYIKEKNRFSLTGNYLSSRLTDGKLLLFTYFRVAYRPDYSDESTFLPQFDTGSGMKSIPAENIICPDELTSTEYTVVSMLDEKTLTLKNSYAMLSYSRQIYVSEDKIFLPRQYEVVSKNIVYTSYTDMTEISCLSYSGDILAPLGSATVKGYLTDQYSMDAYNGILRVVTTTEVITNKFEVVPHRFNENSVLKISASLYCIDLDTWEIIGRSENFAPEGESVRSVRFDKDAAYVCTSVLLTDPVFFFDLSDISNITYKDTGTIAGFSSSLVSFGDGYLLGIGRGDGWDTLKIEVYKETEDGVISVDKYEIENVSYSDHYKSYLIDREHHFVGFGFYKYDRNESIDAYVLLSVKDGKINEIAVAPLSGDNANKRAVYIDGYLYMFGHGEYEFAVLKISE